MRVSLPNVKHKKKQSGNIFFELELPKQAHYQAHGVLADREIILKTWVSDYSLKNIFGIIWKLQK